MPRPEHRNLILVTVDAWRADFADAHGGVPLLPALAPLAAHTARFSRGYANAPWTTPALVSILTGESPARHRVFHQWSSPREGSPSLATRLREAGYAVPNLSYLSGVGGYQNLGYHPREAPEPPHTLQDESLLRALRSHREPFFLWYHYKWLHLPYGLGAEGRRRMGIEDGAIPPRLRNSICSQFIVPRDQFHFLPEDQELIRRLYAAGVLELNAFLEPVLEELDRGGLLERTTFAITADHGEELLDHGHVGHASTALHATLYEEVLHVPLFIVDGRIEGPITIHARAQGMDLHGTLLSMAGLQVGLGPGAFDFSKVILDPGAPHPDEDRPFYFHSAREGFRTRRELEEQAVEGFSDGRVKFIHERFEDERCWRYDLGNDPEEREPIPEPEEGRLYDRLRALRAELR